MQVRTIIACLLCMALAGIPLSADAQRTRNDKEKQRQWTSMENGPWDFAPDWYYYFLHQKYSGAEMYWKWGGIQIRFPGAFQRTEVQCQAHHADPCNPPRRPSGQKVKKVEEEQGNG